MKTEDVIIINNNEIASEIWEMEFLAPKISSNYKGAGQFIQIQLDPGWGNPLRRPMSIASCRDSKISIIYKIFGQGTKILSQKISGDVLNVLGPLGNSFQYKKNNLNILVGGGVGLAPIINLWKELDELRDNSYLIIGTKTKNEHIHSHNPDEHIYLTTDDGSMGLPGTVMEALKLVYENAKSSEVFACGPEPMLKQIQSFVIRNNIPAQLSVESYMGCGVGICQGCIISRRNHKNKNHSYHEKYSLVCVDGPIYSAGDIIFE